MGGGIRVDMWLLVWLERGEGVQSGCGREMPELLEMGGRSTFGGGGEGGDCMFVWKCGRYRLGKDGEGFQLDQEEVRARDPQPKNDVGLLERGRSDARLLEAGGSVQLHARVKKWGGFMLWWGRGKACDWGVGGGCQDY